MRRSPRFLEFIESVRPDIEKLRYSGTYGKDTRKMAKANGRQHKATFSKDKMMGGYRIRVSGPMANRFAGREVPVTLKDGSEKTEKLLDLIVAGDDEETGELWALYTFERKPKVSEEDLVF